MVSATVSCGKDLHELEGARHAALGERDGADAGDVGALEEHLALGGHQQAGQQVDERGLAGAVRSNDRDELAFADRDGHVLERAEIAVVLGHALGFDQRGHAGTCAACAG